MKKEVIRVLAKEPGMAPVEKNIRNEFEELQKLVGGHIEAVTFFHDLAVICNKEGRIYGLPFNCEFCNVDFCGPIVFVGVDGEEFDDFPVSEDAFRRIAPGVWRGKR